LIIDEGVNMRKLVLGLSATALMATAAFAQETATDNSRLAAADSSVFTKLDADADGRVSAIEAANDSKVAAGFTNADSDKDGYLSMAEFSNLGKSKGSMNDGSSAAPSPRSDSTSPDDSSTTPRQ
jgi:EF hand